MTDPDPLTSRLRPTAERPLLGLTILVVEDSRFACDAMRLLCLRSGARIRRADCLSSARRHLKVYRPNVAIIDVGLPDGSGLELIHELSDLAPRIDVLLGTSGDPFAESQVIDNGADGFFAKPLTSVALFQSTIIANLPEERRLVGLRSISDDPVQPDRLAFRDDLLHAADALGTGHDDTIDYVAQFLSGVAHSAGDEDLHQAAQQVSRFRASGQEIDTPLAALTDIVQARLGDRRLAI